jgi:hypothetical protein
MTNISTMMEQRAEITEQLDSVPSDLASEAEFKETFGRKWQLEGNDTFPAGARRSSRAAMPPDPRLLNRSPANFFSSLPVVATKSQNQVGKKIRKM